MTEAGRETILTVEDRPEVLDVLRRTLLSYGYRVITATDGQAGLTTALDSHPDLVVLDIGLPKLSGLEVAKELRDRGFRKPILMLTAMGTVPDRVTGLEAGADDYLTKPFDYQELLARISALLRRAQLRADDAILHVEYLALDTLNRTATCEGKPIGLTAREYALLEFLMRHAGFVVTREQIAEQVWKQPLDPDSNIVDVYMSYLRQKLNVQGTEALLHTVRGIGYMLGKKKYRDTEAMG